jgi:8-oxo-dGTP pyrophosphatase MutT (NUDIX family)
VSANPAAAGSPTVGLIPAATVVLIRPAAHPSEPAGFEVLLTQRPTTMRFGPGMHVFPGGRLDPGETHRDAAVRETAEETGIELHPDTLMPLTRWVTPLGLPSRFDARFFGAVVPPATDVRQASEEVAGWAWLRPIEALEGMAAGRLAMWQPTVVTLQQIEAAEAIGGLEAAFAAMRPPEDEKLDGADAGSIPGVRAFPHRSAGGVEGRPGRTCVLGDRAWVVVDPGDPTGETTDRILAAAAIAGASLAGVVVSDLHPDRQAGVELFARGMALPVLGPPGSSAIAPYPILEATAGAEVPFGDAALIVEVSRPSGPPDPDVAATRWADRAGRLRLRPAA